MTTTRLVQWYRKSARALPWRQCPRDPYHVVVSEFMLQQTQVDRVAPRFESFVRRFPTFASLAAATEDEVVGEWSGLGYYRRARMLHALAAAVIRRGGLPETARALEDLPGVGPYTAAAVASLAFGEAAPVLDGNTLRVGARVLGMDADPRSASGRRRVGAWIVEQMAGEEPGEVNEALMELGASLCSPHDPDCGRCPFGGPCKARVSGRQSEIPPPKKRRTTVVVKWAAACIIDEGGRWLLKRIDQGPILRGLWLPPLIECAAGDNPLALAAASVPDEVVSDPEPASPVRHHITHRRIEVVPVRFEVERFEPPSDSWRWADPHDSGVPTSSLLGKLVDALRF